jgi:hypothetical protein
VLLFKARDMYDRWMIGGFSIQVIGDIDRNRLPDGCWTSCRSSRLLIIEQVTICCCCGAGGGLEVKQPAKLVLWKAAQSRSAKRELARRPREREKKKKEKNVKKMECSDRKMEEG